VASELAQRELTAAEQALKEAFVAARGYWTPLWDGVLKLDAAFFEAYLRFSEVPWRGGPLEPKVKELIYTAIDAATTHLFMPGLRIHIANALGYGATVDEVMEVLEIVSTLGIHTCMVGAPILREELIACGQLDPVAPDDAVGERAAELRRRFESFHGEWSDGWQAMLELDPDFFERYLALAQSPWDKGTLEPKVRELIHVAIDSSTTHLQTGSLRSHIRGALNHGATGAEIMEALQLTSVLGIHTCTMGVPALLELAGE
jgi:alkylhydroperoxidase/carboxymuconolactone decarboxylase family protein YurZ